jgi:hypothetical protein
MSLPMKIFMILMTPVILFGVYLLVGGFIDFHTDVNAGETFVFVADKSVMIIVIFVSLMLLFIMLFIAWSVKRFLPKKFQTMENILKVFWPVWGILVIVFWFLSIFFDEAYLKFYAAQNDYQFCAKQRGGNKSSDVLLFAKSAQDCEAFHEKDISVKDYRKELGKW